MSRQKCQSASPNFEDQPVELKPGSVPDTIMFKCPGDMCNSDKNNNVPPEKPKCQEMPKTTQCPPKESSSCVKTVDQIEEQKPKPVQEPPPKCTNLPETQNFKCIDSEKDRCNGGDKKAESKNDDAGNQCASAGAPAGPKRNCKCATPIAPIPKVKPCGCKGKGGSGSSGTSCGPNTSCETIPLTMKKSNK